MNEISMLIAYEVTRDMSMQTIEIETPFEVMNSRVIDGKKLVFACILRGGNGLLDGMLSVVPGARVGHIGLYRDPKTLTVVEYYFKMPKNTENRDVIVINTMLTTGHSAVAAMERIQELNPKLIKFICLISSPEGIDIFHRFYPDIAIYTLSVDRELNEEGFILPGFGDAGDRFFGTI